MRLEIFKKSMRGGFVFRNWVPPLMADQDAVTWFDLKEKHEMSANF
jgi:hypothetical protein